VEERSRLFAEEIQATLDGVLPGERLMVSRGFEDSGRHIVQPQGATAVDRRVPILVDGDHLADLSLSLYLGADRSGGYLKTVRSDVAVHSVLDRTPLLRLEYRADMREAPIAHWQIHAERGAFSHLLARAHAHRPGRVGRPHDLASLHLPVGGERFRPCLEDVLQFLVVDCGVDHQPGWKAVVDDGREAWRRRQLRSTVRDSPAETARAMREMGWTITQPPQAGPPKNLRAFTTW